MFGGALKHRQMLVALEPEVRSHSFDLAIAHQQLGQLLVSAERWTEAASAYQSAINGLDALVQMNSRDHASLSQWGRCSSNLGLIQLRLKDPEKAAAGFAVAIEKQQLALELSPDNVEYQKLLEHHRSQALRVPDQSASDGTPAFTSGK